MRIGVVGVGNIGANPARLLTRAGYHAAAATARSRPPGRLAPTSIT